MRDEWEEWHPAWAVHVRGRFTRRVVDEATGAPEEQRVVAECAFPGCGARWQGSCRSGQVRRHVALFAAQHAHPRKF